MREISGCILQSGKNTHEVKLVSAISTRAFTRTEKSGRARAKKKHSLQLSFWGNDDSHKESMRQKEEVDTYQSVKVSMFLSERSDSPTHNYLLFILMLYKVAPVRTAVCG